METDSGTTSLVQAKRHPGEVAIIAPGPWLASLVSYFGQATGMGATSLGRQPSRRSREMSAPLLANGSVGTFLTL
jgi:hypothetical protein